MRLFVRQTNRMALAPVTWPESATPVGCVLRALSYCLQSVSIQVYYAISA